MASEFKLKQDIVEIGKRMYAMGFVASNDGNISARASDRVVLITPTGVSKGYMATSDMLAVDMDGNVLSGTKKPTSEMKMHLEVYRRRADVMAVVHAHPPVATAFAVANKVCDKVSLPEVIFSLGLVSLAEYGTPTTNEIPDAVAKCIGRSDAILLANHGALTVGGDLYDAYYKMETLEHFAKITMYARLLGGERALAPDQVQNLLAIRENVYGKSPVSLDSGVCGGASISGANVPDLPAEGASDGKRLKEIIDKVVREELENLRK